MTADTLSPENQLKGFHPCPLCGNASKQSSRQSSSWKNLLYTEYWCQPCGIKFQKNNILSALSSKKKPRFTRTRYPSIESSGMGTPEVRIAPPRTHSSLAVTKEVEHCPKRFHMEIGFSEKTLHLHVQIEPGAIIASAHKAIVSACRFTIQTLDKTSHIVQDKFKPR